MFGVRYSPPKTESEGEKPFWISYADLMTALMMLFLVVMVASLISVTKKIAIETSGEKQRAADIQKICATLNLEALKVNKNIHVDCKDNRINFGEAGRFGYDGYKLNPEGVRALRDVVPIILQVSNGEEGRKWFKQVLIEGFTDTDGAYLYNLHLSLLRSESVMCTLLSGQTSDYSDEQLRDIKTLFLAGGVSFNNAKDSKEESRRVELRLQFYGLKELKVKTDLGTKFENQKQEICQLK